jgi:pyridoxamine 5'-phosphate oxidase family protein
VARIGFEFDGTLLLRRRPQPHQHAHIPNVQAGKDQVALAIDDLVSTELWTPRFLRIYGTTRSSGALGERSTRRGARIGAVQTECLASWPCWLSQRVP